MIQITKESPETQRVSRLLTPWGLLGVTRLQLWTAPLFIAPAIAGGIHSTFLLISEIRIGAKIVPFCFAANPSCAAILLRGNSR